MGIEVAQCPFTGSMESLRGRNVERKFWGRPKWAVLFWSFDLVFHAGGAI
jgi:hypothetical protein